MKALFKKISKQLGIYYLLRRIRFRMISFRYRENDIYYFNWKHINLLFDTSDNYSKNWFYPRYLNNKIHEPSASSIFKKHISKKGIVLDIGAHLGYFTCLAANLAHEGQVFAFEIDKKCIPLIQRNVEINNLENVIINNKAVSDHNNIEKIPEFKHLNAELSMQNNDDLGTEVSAVKIDDYSSLNSIAPNFIKIDVEGAELKVLNGMLNLLKTNVKILIEIHVEVLKENFNTHYKEILELIERNQFSMCEIECHHHASSNVRKINSSSKLNGNTMIFCKKIKPNKELLIK